VVLPKGNHSTLIQYSTWMPLDLETGFKYALLKSARSKQIKHALHAARVAGHAFARTLNKGHFETYCIVITSCLGCAPNSRRRRPLGSWSSLRGAGAPRAPWQSWRSVRTIRVQGLEGLRCAASISACAHKDQWALRRGYLPHSNAHTSQSLKTRPARLSQCQFLRR